MNCKKNHSIRVVSIISYCSKIIVGQKSLWKQMENELHLLIHWYFTASAHILSLTSPNLLKNSRNRDAAYSVNLLSPMKKNLKVSVSFKTNLKAMIVHLNVWFVRILVSNKLNSVYYYKISFTHIKIFFKYQPVLVKHHHPNWHTV